MRNKNYLDKTLLYFVSLSLLFVLIFVITVDIPIYFGENAEFIGWNDFFSRNLVAVFSFIMFIVSIICLWQFKNSLDGSKKNAIRVSNVENLNYEPLAFLVTYILPLVCLDFDNFRYLIVFLILLVIIGVMYIKTNMFYANPTLAIMGFHIYKVSGKFYGEDITNNVVIITRSIIQEDMNVYWRELDYNVYYVKEVINGGVK